MFTSQLIVLLLTTQQMVLSQDYVDECPVQNGLFADAVQCDRYYECKDGEITDNYCPDGLVYEESSNGFAKCSFPFSVDCEGRPELQPAKPTRFCPRQNGYFVHEDPTVCDKFYFCVDGVPNPITCPASLIFDPNLGQCAYSDTITRKGCSASEVFKFDCPKVTDARHEHPRYPDPNDCQYFYICIGGVHARRNGCTDGQVYNKETLACDSQFNVKNDPVCQQWYNETFLEGIQVPPSPGAVRGIEGGVQIDTSNRQRVVVRRRKPSTQVQQQVSVSQSETMSIGTAGGGASFNQFSGARPTVGPTFNQVPVNRQKVRTRVRRPPVVPEAELIPLEQGPPKFALASDEDIQRFRDSNRFGPGSSTGRLTILNNGGGGGNFQQPPQRQGGNFQEPPQSQGGNFQQPRQRQGGNFQEPQQQRQGGNFQQPPQQRQGGNFQQPPQQRQGGNFQEPQQRQGGNFQEPQQRQGGNFQQPTQRQRPNSIPVEDPAVIQSFAGFAAVPDVPPLEDYDYDEDPIVPTFGNRFKSRRPPSRNPVPVQTLPERIPEQTEPAFGSNFRSRPAVPDSNSFESLPSRSNVRNRPAAADPVSDDFPSRTNFRSRPPPPSRQSQVTDQSFEPQRQTPRQRLQVTEIKVNPQLAQEFDQESIDVDAFRRVANQFRQRGSQQ